MSRRTLLGAGSLAAIGAAYAGTARANEEILPVTIDTRQSIGPLPHIWTEC